MAGLLDFLQSPDAQFGVNLLSAASPTMQPMGFGQRLAAGLAATREQQAEAEARAQRQQYVMAQLGALQSQADDRRLQQVLKMQELQREQAKRDALPSLWKSPAQAALAGGGGPTAENAARLEAAPQGGQFDVQAALAAGYSPKEISDLAGLRNVARPKVARTIETKDEQGRPVTLQLDEFGQPIGQGMQQWKAPIQVQQGDRTTFADPVTLAARGSFALNMSPDAKASNAVAWANNAISRSRLAFDQQQAGGANGELVFNGDAGGYIPKRILPGQTPSVVSLPGLAPQKGSPEAKRQSAEQVINLLGEADKLLNTATGSYGGKGVDMMAAAVGKSTQGAKAAASLKAIEGALVLNMPRMEGPQSDRDAALYRQAAAQIGDDTLPAETRRSALQMVRKLQQTYTGGAPAPSTEPASPLSLPGFTITEIR